MTTFSDLTFIKKKDIIILRTQFNLQSYFKVDDHKIMILKSQTLFKFSLFLDVWNHNTKPLVEKNTFQYFDLKFLRFDPCHNLPQSIHNNSNLMSHLFLCALIICTDYVVAAMFSYCTQHTDAHLVWAAEKL